MTSQTADADTPPPDDQRADEPRPDEPADRAGAPMPDYRGAPLDPDRGPGLGCFWAQVVVLAVLLVLTPLTVILAMEPWISALLLVVTLGLLLFVGQTTIFLLRLVAADRRTRRRPLSATARKTVGQLEEAQRAGESNEAADSGESDASGTGDQPD